MWPLAALLIGHLAQADAGLDVAHIPHRDPSDPVGVTEIHHFARRFPSKFAALAAALVLVMCAPLFVSACQPQAGAALRLVHSDPFTEYPLPTPSSSPEGIAAGRDGNLWFSEYGNNAIGRMSPNGALKGFPLPRSGSEPVGITLGQDGAMWFAESFASIIGRITAAGIISEFSIPSGATNPSGATSITTGPDGNLWFLEGHSDRIGRITPQGSVTDFPLPSSGNNLMAITAGTDGNLWFLEYDEDALGQLTP
jgi:streptogramin lyase